VQFTGDENVAMSNVCVNAQNIRLNLNLPFFASSLLPRFAQGQATTPSLHDCRRVHGFQLERLFQEGELASGMRT
jgi:hypothetical protein